MTIYVLTNRENGRSYVGQAVNVMKRLYEHVRIAKPNAEMLISKAIHKYGPDAFSVKLIALGDGATRDDANAAERWWIAQLGTIYPSGYNLTAGGCVQEVLAVTREKMSRARLGWCPSQVTRAKLSAALKGRSLSQETRARMSAARKGRPQKPEHIAARNAWVRSEETRAKISAKKRARDAAMRLSASNGVKVA